MKKKKKNLQFSCSAPPLLNPSPTQTGFLVFQLGHSDLFMLIFSSFPFHYTIFKMLESLFSPCVLALISLSMLFMLVASAL